MSVDHSTVTPTEIRLAVWRNGYDPLPLSGKSPSFRKEWQNGYELNEDYIRDWEKQWGYFGNTGILARRTPCLDLDILNPEAAEALEEYVDEQWIERGHILVRIGRAPKRAIIFRTDTFFKKINLPLIAPDGSEQKIEFLADGQQFAAFGIHPDTGNPYRWQGGSPFNIERQDLPYIHPDEAQDLVNELCKIVSQFGYTLKSKKKPNSGGDQQADTGDASPFDWERHWGNLIDNDNNTELAMAIVRGGMQPGPAIRMMIGAIKANVSDDDAERKQRRLNDVKGQVKSACRKINSENNPDETLESVRADAVEMTSIHWLWSNRFAFGKLGLITGLPDEGKGQLLWYIIAQATTGGEWPCGEGAAPIGNVIVLEAEDDLNDTVIPRLKAAGAELSRVHILNMVKINGRGDKRLFSLVTDLPKLRKKIEEIGEVALVVVDPISAYLGRTKEVDTFRATDVRNVLGPFVELAAEMNVAIIGIMHFNKKVDVTNVLLRVSDSVAFTAAARHLYGVIDDPANKRKLFVRGKNNVASSEQKTLAYRFGLRMVGLAPDGEEIWAPHILWEPKPVDITPSEAMSSGNGRPPKARANAKDFLKKKLAGGAVKMDDLIDEANAEGITRPTLYRSKMELQIGSRKDENGKWLWFLPEQPKPRYLDD
jgi:hypothetical protein